MTLEEGTEPDQIRDTRMIAIPCGIQIATPESLRLITPYVLTEQADWFEDELRFIRALSAPGMNAIDVGASFGIYTLTLAKLIQPSGHVWAFEPTTATAEYLRRGTTENGLDSSIDIDTTAVSDREGTSTFYLHDNSELNGLGVALGAQRTESVATSSLDVLAKRWNWDRIDFLKIDAEGAESDIVHGASALLGAADPLVMFEIRHGPNLDLEVVRLLAARGLSTYRLIPGLNVLAPVELEGTLDAYQLNLFACSPRRADELRERGLLVTGLAALDTATPAAAVILGPGRAYARNRGASRTTDEPSVVHRSISSYEIAENQSLTPSLRHAALLAALAAARQAVAGHPGACRLMTLARIARDAGERAEAVSAIAQAAHLIVDGAALNESFLPPISRFDALEPDADGARWCLAALLEGLEKLSSFSSFFVGRRAIPRIEQFLRLGYPDNEMSRRLELLLFSSLEKA